MLKLIIAAVALVLVLLGILYEEKLIAFEDRIFEYFAYLCAHVVAWYRNKKAGRKAWTVKKF
jgi:hypothetical protein